MLMHETRVLRVGTGHNEFETYHCLPVFFRDDGEIEIEIGINMAVFFTEDKLPDEVKEKLAIVWAVDKRTDLPPLGRHLYYTIGWQDPPYMYPELSDTGWRLSGNCICLVLSNTLVEQLTNKYIREK